jgi:SAM-dependent methyltransferase
MNEVSFIAGLHTKTKRDYIGRMTELDKAECASVAKKWGRDYWDGDRKYGYGGYKYDGRWSVVAEAIIKYYELPQDAKILDVGCGKGFLLYEFKKLLPECQIRGIDISDYAIENCKEEVREFISLGNANSLNFNDGEFDLVISITTLHNLLIFDLKPSVQEIRRVTRSKSYIAVESFRNEQEKVNLLCWQLTCQSFYTPDEWLWIYQDCGYRGDYEFIYFE